MRDIWDCYWGKTLILIGAGLLVLLVLLLLLERLL
jgi:hypothetical protein